jgi:hypothetical protein
MVYPFAPYARYQEFMRIDLVAGNSSDALFDGVFGITIDLNEAFAFVTESTGRKVRKVSLKTSFASLDVTRKLHSNCFIVA